jgi:hypothetical protein
MYFEGDINDDIDKISSGRGMQFLKSEIPRRLFLANLARWTAETSCVWFYGGEDRVERRIGIENIDSMNHLLIDLG